MKLQKQLFFSLILAIGLLLTSCQKESLEVIEIIPENTHQLNSQLVLLISSIVMNDGSVDNFIDGYDCFSIAFPFEIYVDSIHLNVLSQADYVEVANLIEETDANFGDIEIIFPITIIHSDYSELYVNNAQELDANILGCNDINIGIDCIDLNYPLTLFVYDSITEISNSYNINNDNEFYFYLSNMNEEDYISIQFPVSVTTQSNEVVNVVDGIMLQSLINDCVEQEVDPITLTNYLVDDVWYVSFNFQEINSTQNFCEYYIDFNVDGSMIATNGNVSINGTWKIGYEDDAIYVEFVFDNEAPFNNINDKWFVNSASSETLGLEKPGSLGDIDLLTIDHIPTGC
ncbi:MAG: hypothetical protein ACI9SJ_000163 [Flavobacteriaceae bacterium]|jgi:hypothetical protein|uniref:hypothetical protein n=1 Tax=Candidatus Marifrigoribacter sp. Uisw_064 TaxID=3230970 RepID=UPI003AE635A1